MKFLQLWVQLEVSAHSDWGFLGGSVVKNLPTNAGDVGLIPGSGRFPGEGNGNLLQYLCKDGHNIGQKQQGPKRNRRD